MSNLPVGGVQRKCLVILCHDVRCEAQIGNDMPHLHANECVPQCQSEIGSCMGAPRVVRPQTHSVYVCSTRPRYNTDGLLDVGDEECTPRAVHAKDPAPRTAQDGRARHTVLWTAAQHICPSRCARCVSPMSCVDCQCCVFRQGVNVRLRWPARPTLLNHGLHPE